MRSPLSVNPSRICRRAGVAVVRGFRSERVFLGMFGNGRHPTCILWELQVNVALHGSGMDCVKHPTHT